MGCSRESGIRDGPLQHYTLYIYSYPHLSGPELRESWSNIPKPWEKKVFGKLYSKAEVVAFTVEVSLTPIFKFFYLQFSK